MALYGLCRNVTFYNGDITKKEEVGDALKKVRRSLALSRVSSARSVGLESEWTRVV
jgi:predicted transcriptional regulator